MNKIVKLAIIVVVIFVSINVVDARTLSIGSTGGDVVSLQSFLIARSFPIPLIENGKANKGYFGTQTRDAVMMYQEANEIQPTGVIDSNSYTNSYVDNGLNKPIRLGAVSGPDFYGPYWNMNGIITYYHRKDFNRDTFGVLGTTTPCVFLSPTSTSTLSRASVNIVLSTTTPAVKWTLATSTTAYATTTALYQFTAVAGKLHSWEWVASSTSPTGSLGFGTTPPSTYLVFGNEGVASSESQPYGFRIGGSCQAEFRVL